MISSVTGRLEPLESPAWKRRAFRYLVSFPIIGLCLALVFVVMVVMLRLQVPDNNRNIIQKILCRPQIAWDGAYCNLHRWSFTIASHVVSQNRTEV